jgi:hypothetical protein
MNRFEMGPFPTLVSVSAVESRSTSGHIGTSQFPEERLSDFSLPGRNHAEGWPGGRIDALKISARRAEYSLTGDATSPFQAESTHLRDLRV